MRMRPREVFVDHHLCAQGRCTESYLILITTLSVLFAAASPVPNTGPGMDAQGVFSEWMKECSEAL